MFGLLDRVGGMDTMQAVVFHAPHDVRVEEVPKPEVEEPGDVVLKVDRAAICGTDLHPYSGRMEMEEGATLGHEYLGTIEAKGDGVTEFEEGERAVHAEETDADDVVL
jgi:threonine dehydrogenase-like Zn-dependent dehydrogenase